MGLVEIGLTRRQAQVYALWHSGRTHKQIAERFNMHRPHVTATIARARRRVPSLPLPPHIVVLRAKRRAVQQTEASHDA